MNAPSYFEIQAEDPTRAVKFYTDIFSWKFTLDPNITTVEYWRIETEGARGGLLKRPTKTPGAGFGTNAYVNSMEVKSFDEMSEQILKSGGIVALPKFAIPGKCWQGYFLDTEGNTFGIFQVDASAK